MTITISIIISISFIDIFFIKFTFQHDVMFKSIVQLKYSKLLKLTDNNSVITLMTVRLTISYH